MQELFDLKMGSLTMEEYVKKFLDLMRYVDCIKDEKIKIQRFLRVDCHHFTRTGYSMMNPSPWRKQLERLSVCMSKEKEMPTSIDLRRIKGRTIKIRERRGLNHLLFREIHFNKDKESPVTVRFPSQRE